MLTEAAPSEWSEQKIRSLLASEAFNYQNINLPFGISTGGHDRSKTADLIFAGDWAGQSVLDVGCSLGYFLFEAQRRGAGRAVGLELSPDNVRKGGILADILKQKVEFKVGDIDKAPVGEVFDNVLCLNVLHHLTDPILGLNRLVDATRRRLVLEVATIGAHDRRKLGLNLLQSSVMAKLPVLLIGRGTAGEGVKQFYLTIPAIENLLRFRRGCFASVTVKPSDFKERFLVIAEKRRIEELLVVSGPAGFGTKPDIEKALAAASGVVSDLQNFKGATILDAVAYHEPQEPENRRLILNYDLMRPLVSGAVTFDHDPALDIIGTARKVSFLTLSVGSEELKERLGKAAAAGTGRAKKQLGRTISQFSATTGLASLYRDWLGFTEGRGEHASVALDGTQVGSRPDWLRKLARHE